MAFRTHRVGQNLRSDRFVEAAGGTARREAPALQRERGTGRPRKMRWERRLRLSFRGFCSRAQPLQGAVATAVSGRPPRMFGPWTLLLTRSPPAQGFAVALVMFWTL